MKKIIAYSIITAVISTAAYGAFFNYEAHNITGDGGTITGFVIPWSQIDNTPTTCLGYGIVDCGTGGGTPTTSLPWDNITNTGGVTTSELTYLHGTTSSIQTQFGLKAPLASPAFTGTVVLPSTTSIGSVSSTEIDYLDNVTSSIQTQLNNKMSYSANLYNLSYPGINRIFYSNSSGLITMIPLGDNNTYLKSQGTSSAPTWGTAGGVVSLDNTTMDNTTVGATTPSTGQFTTLRVTQGDAKLDNGATIPNNIDVVAGDNGWKSRYDSTNNSWKFYTTAIIGSTDAYPMFQVQVNSGGGVLDTGQTVFAVRDYTTDLLKVSEGGAVEISGEVTASQFTSTALDNQYYINVANTSDPTGENMAAGNLWVNKTYDQIRFRSSDNSVTVGYDPVRTIQILISDPSDSDDVIFYYTTKALTITRVVGLAQGGDNVIGQVQVCSNPSTCSDTQTSDTTFTTVGVSNTTFSSPDAAADQWLKWKMTTVNGSVTFALIQVFYYETY